MTYRFLLFIALWTFSIFILWISGHNFDRRSEGIALYFIISTFLVLLGASVPMDSLDEKIFKNKEI